MARLESIMPFFIVDDLSRSMAFYRDVLGFEIRLVTPPEDPFFAIVGRDGVGILLKVITRDVGPLPNPLRHEWARWDAYIHAPDPDSLAEECRRRRPELKLTVEDTEDGLRGFEIDDADGYRLFLGRVRDD